MKKYELAMQTGLVPRTSDTGKDITLRNASEHKRLEGQLKHLDLQLRSKLVSMQAEIMELKASQYEKSKKPKRRTPRLLESRDRTYSDGRLQQRRRPRTLTNGNQLTDTYDSPLVPQPSPPETQDKKDSGSELVLPEINPKQTCLVGNASKTSNDQSTLLFRSDSIKRKNKSGMSSIDNVLLNVPSPSSMYRPSSLPDLSRLGPNGGGSVSPRSSRRVQFTIPESKNRQNKSIVVKEEEPSIPTEPQNTLSERVNDFIKQTETKKNIEIVTENLETPAIEVSDAVKGGAESGAEKDNEISEEADVFYNSMLAKGTMEDADLSDNAPDLASLGFMDFNDVIDKRLKQTQEKLPSEEEMRKIRYLRWRHEAPQLDLVKTVFEKPSLEDLEVDNSKLQLVGDGNDNDDENNLLKSSK